MENLKSVCLDSKVWRKTNITNEGDVVIPDSFEYNGEKYLIDEINGKGFLMFNPEITSITIPNSVKKIDGQSFRCCENLKKVNLSEGLIQIGPGAFTGCVSLTDITIPSTVERIRLHAFNGCVNLTNLNILNGVLQIEEGAFEECRNLKSVTIPESVINVEKFAFLGCRNLIEVNWNAKMRPTQEQLEYIFAVCPKLESINYHGIKLDLRNESLDDLINEKTELSSEEQNLSLDQIIKDAGEER